MLLVMGEFPLNHDYRDFSEGSFLTRESDSSIQLDSTTCDLWTRLGLGTVTFQEFLGLAKCPLRVQDQDSLLELLPIRYLRITSLYEKHTKTLV